LTLWSYIETYALRHPDDYNELQVAELQWGFEGAEKLWKKALHNMDSNRRTTHGCM